MTAEAIFVANTLAWFAMAEVVGLPVFYALRFWLGPHAGRYIFSIETFKGAIERLVVLVGLLSGFPQILIAFGALKIANRLADEDNNDRAKNYFLIGNLMSILVVILVFHAVQTLPIVRI